MVKNKVLTPVLAGVLGVSVVGSGIGYYLVNKDGGNNKSNQTMDSMKISLTQVGQNVNNSISDVEKAVKGELDYAYDSSVKISFGDAVNAQGSDGKNAVKPLELSTKVKQKGANSQAEISAKYNDATLVTLETIYARDKNAAYFRIPELSSAYITATEADLQKLFEDYANKYKDQIGGSGIALPDTNLQGGASADIKAPDLSSIDSDKLQKNIEGYAELFKSKLPGKKDGANLTGDIDGNKYDYKTVNYTITGKQVQEAVLAVVDKAASDTELKKLFDEIMKQQTVTSVEGSKAMDYADFIAQLKKELNKEVASDMTASADVYYDGEEVTGCALSYNGTTYAKIVIINKSDVNAIDAFFSDGSEADAVTIKGSAKLVDGAINGQYTFTAKDTGTTAASATLKLDKVVIKDDYFNGTISVNVQSGDQSVAMTLSGDSAADKKNVKLTVDLNGKNAVTVEFKLNKTEASDVAVPTGKTFTLDQMDQYQASCDIESFKQGLNDALGVNIFGGFDSYLQQSQELIKM